jgi:hypothetical protein
VVGAMVGANMSARLTEAGAAITGLNCHGSFPSLRLLSEQGGLLSMVICHPNAFKCVSIYQPCYRLISIRYRDQWRL